ncbi:hypothetical protein PanWU01x14_264060, partial [Parasponia andersonii]
QNLKQDGLDVIDYSTTLTKIWQELDLFDCNDWYSNYDKKYYKTAEKQRAYDFLAGPNKDLDKVRGHLLGIKPIPAIDEIFVEVRQEEYRKKVMLGNPKVVIQPENSAFAARGVKPTHGDDNSNRRDSQTPGRGKLWCNNCQRTNHT